MIKVRNFVTITIVIAIVFFLFASQGMARLSLSDKGENHYAYSAKEVSGDNEVSWRSYIYAGESAELYHTAQQYALVRHASIRKVSHASQAGTDGFDFHTVLLIDGSQVGEDDISYMEKVLEDYHLTIVFMTLPDESLIQSSETLRDILGIQRDRGEIHLKGYQLLEGFMLGGEGYYVEKKVNAGEQPRQDLPLDITYYEVAASSRLYMIGQIDPEEQGITDMDDDNTKGPLDSEDYPAIIWQHAPENGHVFCVNGDFMSDDTGLGILSGIEYETSDYMISAFADARSMVVENFPDLSDENASQIKELYGQSPYNFQRNVLWPFIVAAASINNDRITAMATDHIEDGSGRYERMDSYLTLTENERAELGAMGDSTSLVTEGLRSTFPKYDITSFYGQYDRGVVVDDDSRYLYGSDGEKLSLRKTLDADEMTYSDDLRFRGIVSATGYYVTSLDVSKVIYPNSEEDRYEKVSRRTNGNLRTFYGKFDYLDALPLSQMAGRIEKLISSPYIVRSASRNRNMAVIDVTDRSEMPKLLIRTHDQKIAAIKGATYEKKDDDCYILTATGNRIVMRFENEDKPTLTEKK